MSRRTDQLTADALALPPEERARLAEVLLASLDGDEAEDTEPTAIEAEWRAHVGRGRPPEPPGEQRPAGA